MFAYDSWDLPGVLLTRKRDVTISCFQLKQVGHQLCIVNIRAVESRSPPGRYGPRCACDLLVRTVTARDCLGCRTLLAKPLFGANAMSMILPIAAFPNLYILLRTANQNRETWKDDLNELRRDSGPIQQHFARNLFLTTIRFGSQKKPSYLSCDPSGLLPPVLHFSRSS